MFPMFVQSVYTTTKFMPYFIVFFVSALECRDFVLALVRLIVDLISIFMRSMLMRLNYKMASTSSNKIKLAVRV